MRFKLPEIPPPKLITALRNYNLLPAIVFLPTRRKCDEAATEVAADRSQRTDPEKAERRQAMFDVFAAQFPEIRSHKHRKILLRGGIAVHHAGHIPAWKLLIEKMMSAGLLNAIFATSTVAAGVDFPARTVVVSNADTRGNEGWRSLLASELQQMTGRAGRRGKDIVGFVVVAPGQFQNPPKIAQLLKSPPDALSSRFRATYSSLLNLLDAFKSFAQVREIAERSFAFRETAHRITMLERGVDEAQSKIDRAIAGNTYGITRETVRGFERLTSARLRLQERLPQTRVELRFDWLRRNVEPGRLVTKGRNSRRFFLVLNVFGEKIVAMRDDGQGATLAFGQIGRVFASKYDLNEDSLEKGIDDVYRGDNPALEEPRPVDPGTAPNDAVETINAALGRLPGPRLSGDAERAAHQLLWGLWNDASFIESTRRDIDILRDQIWLPFDRRARVLDHFGYLDHESEQVTDRGKWLADVRVDRPLLVGEALSRGIFNGLDIKTAAALMASLAADPDRSYGEIYLSNRVLDLLTEFEEIVFEVSNVEWRFGVEPTPDLNFSAAATAECWAAGMPWDELVFRSKAEEGDLVRLLSRTGEALRQVAQLKGSNPDAAELARRASETILREPIR